MLNDIPVAGHLQQTDRRARRREKHHRGDAVERFRPMHLDGVGVPHALALRELRLNDDSAVIRREIEEPFAEPQLLGVVIQDARAPYEIEPPQLGDLIRCQVEKVRLDKPS